MKAYYYRLYLVVVAVVFSPVLFFAFLFSPLSTSAKCRAFIDVSKFFWDMPSNSELWKGDANP